MKYALLLIVFIWAQYGLGASHEKIEAKVLNIYSGDHIYSRRIDLTFSNFLPIRLFLYKNPKYDVECNLWEFYQLTEDDDYVLLLPADLNPKGQQPEVYEVKTKVNEHDADIIVLSKFHGTGMIWSKNVYRYTGESIELKNTFYGYEDAPHADPATGKAMRTAPTWWDPDGSPMISQTDRLKQDEQGNTWRLVSDEVVEEDHSPPTRKAIMSRRDSDTGYWWKNLSE